VLNKPRIKYRTYVEVDANHVGVYALYVKLSVHNDAHICISLFKIVFDEKLVYVQGAAIMLSNMFAGYFDDQIDRNATLVDPNNNEFHVLVERFNDSVFFLTKG